MSSKTVYRYKTSVFHFFVKGLVIEISILSLFQYKKSVRNKVLKEKNKTEFSVKIQILDIMWWGLSMWGKKKKNYIALNYTLFSFWYVRDRFFTYLNFIIWPFLQFLTKPHQNSDSSSLSTCFNVCISIIMFWDKNFWKFLNFLLVHIDANHPEMLKWFVTPIFLLSYPK